MCLATGAKEPLTHQLRDMHELVQVAGEALAIPTSHLEAAKAGRIWLNLRHTNDHLSAYAALEREIFADETQ